MIPREMAGRGGQGVRSRMWPGTGKPSSRPQLNGICRSGRENFLRAALGKEVFGVALGGEVSAVVTGKAATMWRLRLVVIGGSTWGRAAPRSHPSDKGDEPTEKAHGGGKRAS